MTNLEALQNLAAEINSGTASKKEIAIAARSCTPRGAYLDFAIAYDGSLDAASALHDRLLPGWWWSVGTCRVSDDARVSPEGDDSVTPDGREWADITDVDMRPPGNPARAWLLSIVLALIYIEEGRV